MRGERKVDSQGSTVESDYRCDCGQPKTLGNAFCWDCMAEFLAMAEDRIARTETILEVVKKVEPFVVYRCGRKLTKTQKQRIKQYHKEGFSQTEIARRVKVAESSVKRWI